MSIPRHKTFLADFALIIATVIWGSSFFIIKDQIKTLEPVTLVAYRFLLATFLFGIFLRAKKIKLFENWRRGFLLGLFLAVMYLTQTISMRYTSASNSALLTGTAVLFLPIISLVFFHKLPHLFRIFAGILALRGLWILTGGLNDFNFGDFLNLVTALSVAVHLLLVDRFVKTTQNIMALNFQQLLVTTVVAFLMALGFQDSLVVETLSGLYAILYLGVFATALTIATQLIAQKYTKPMKVALIFTLEPVFAVYFAWLFGGEILTQNKIFGGALIVIAMLISEIPVQSWVEGWRKKSLH